MSFRTVFIMFSNKAPKYNLCRFNSSNTWAFSLLKSIELFIILLCRYKVKHFLFWHSLSNSLELYPTENLWWILKGKWIKSADYNTMDSFFYCTNRGTRICKYKLICELLICVKLNLNIYLLLISFIQFQMEFGILFK